MTVGELKLTPWLDPDWRIAHKLASTWVAAFWGAVGAGISFASVFITMGNVWWLGPILLLAGASFGVARFTNQPGAN